MNELFGLLHDLSELAFEIGRVAAGNTARVAWIVVRRISLVARLAIVWPFILLLAALPSWKYWPVQYIVLTVTILILLAFLWMMTSPVPLSIFVAESILSPETQIVGRFVEKARKATNALRIILGFELLLGIYFSWVPIANNRPLALTQILIVAAIVCFVGIKKWEPVVVILAVVFCVITLVFFPWSNINLGKVFGKTQDDTGGSSGAVHDQQSRPPAGQPAAQTSPDSSLKDSGDPAGSPVGQPAPPAPPPPPEPLQWYKPLSGDEGGYTVRISSGRYITAGKVGFRISIQPPDGSTSEGLYIDESDGGDNMGSFSAYPNAIAENYIHCTGPSYPCKMFSGTPTYLDIEVDRPAGVNKFAFTLKVAPGGMAWIKYDFADVPVAER
jgi:hypothetical protein